MGCNCKSSGRGSNSSAPTKLDFKTIVYYSIKVFGFLIGLILIPFLVLIIVWFMFDTIVLNKDVNLELLMRKLINLNNKLTDNEIEYDEDEEEEDDEEEYTEENYVTVNVEEITEKN